MPELAFFLDPTTATAVPFDRTWQQARFEPFIQIHTSGSTGIPKLITTKHGNWSALDATQSIGGNELGARGGKMRYCSTFPPFHVAGLICTLALPCWIDSTSILPPAGPVNAHIVNRMHVEAQAMYSFLPPSIIIDLVKNSEFLENLSRLKGVSFGGGPLPEPIGAVVAERTELVTGWGSSEYQAVPQLRIDKEDWAYFRFNELEGGIEFHEFEAGLYEMVHVRKPHLGLIQSVFITFPDLQEFHTKDLFTKHPTKSGLWKYASRLDDIIVLSNAEKLNPTTMEGMVTAAPEVQECVVIGQGRFQACALIEPIDDGINNEELLDRVWPIIQRANESTVKHGRIAKDFVFFTKPEKPLPRAGKGTVQRAASNKLYADEIDQLYASFQSGVSSGPNGLSPVNKTAKIDLCSVQATQTSLEVFLAEEADIKVNGVSVDFFALGMDSLQLINLVRAINAARPANPLDPKQVYDHPSIKQLASYLHADVVENSQDGYDSDNDAMKAAWTAMDKMFQSYAQQVDETHGTRSSRRHMLSSRHQSSMISQIRAAWCECRRLFHSSLTLRIGNS